MVIELKLQANQCELKRFVIEPITKTIFNELFVIKTALQSWNLIRKKIEPDPRSPRYLQTVWGEGYMLVPD